jgi:cholesterol oxidase
MLGVVENPVETPADRVMLEVATDMGVADTFHRTQCGRAVRRSARARTSRTRSSAGPARPVPRATRAASCMTGCRLGAKNTLPKNYLHLAEGLGATIQPLTTVTTITPRRPGRVPGV